MDACARIALTGRAAGCAQRREKFEFFVPREKPVGRAPVKYQQACEAIKVQGSPPRAIAWIYGRQIRLQFAKSKCFV